MDWGLVLVCGLLIAVIIFPVAAVMGTVDALGHSRAAWARSGFRRLTWVWQAVGLCCAPLVVIYTGAYLVRVRPRLLAAERDLAREHGYGVGGVNEAASLDARRTATPSAAPGSSVARVRIRASISVTAATAAPLIVMAVMNTVFEVTAPAEHRSSETNWWIASLLVSCAVVAMTASFGVTLTAHEAIVHGLRRRRLRWDKVVAVTQDRSMGSRYIRVWTDDGRSRRLRAPYVPFLGIGRRHFETNFHVIGRWWLDHRGIASAD